ncbi:MULTISPECIES: lysine 2,3-aminomutase [unclassified Streptomyces]|uniref:KamA family radical SAM protein n=1 Tax=unclassified Streptomyces TaxID=2593676 RepID=UPI00339E61D7
MANTDLVADDAYCYQPREPVEPDWTRFRGWRDVSAREWRDPRWQRTHSVRSARRLRDVVGDWLADSVYEDLLTDQERYATMSVLLTPQMLNTMVPSAVPRRPGGLTDAFYADPVRRYMLPLASDRLRVWSSHPTARRDPLHEQEMWATEGLTHRYPTKVLAELTATCPQYCGHCTRMDLVGPSVPQVVKARFDGHATDRLAAMLKYIQANPQIRDVVVSGGDVANVAWYQLEGFVTALLETGQIRDIRLAAKSLAGLPQHWLSTEVRSGLERLAALARRRRCSLALHTHVNATQSVTPLVAEASRALLEAGLSDVRNQGVLMRGVNDTPAALLDLCFALADSPGITPYYFYMCDIVPHSEHWRLTLAESQALQDAIMGWLPGFSTPRLVCDVARLGKRWVHQAVSYDRERGISTWGQAGLPYFDPIHALPPAGRAWWKGEEALAHTALFQDGP